ncbi:hypothetical protein NST04_28785 [Paenibacillus sp. FSL H7-0756]|uniref:hypothetical protein n=1 Tax=Paenibacillus sp. FSL H7-0756 TaxID=2954738 RepID=UPI0030F74E77
MKNILKKSLNTNDLNKLFQAGMLTKRSIHGSLDEEIIREHFSITDIGIKDNAVIPIPGVTFVFDLEGSSVSIRDRGEQDFIDRFSQMFKSLTNIIYSNNGIVEKFPGDGISAHFLQNAEESFAICRRRAASTANDIQTYMRNQNYSGFRISMWSGQSTVATTIGDENHHEIISIGHGVNVAHKLEKTIKDSGFTVGMDRDIWFQYKAVTGKAENVRTLPTNLRSATEQYWYGA